MTSLANLSVMHDPAALRRAGFPLAIRQLFASLFAKGREAALPSRAEKAQREAESVRRMADGFRESDPDLASDLYAAANRHEVASGCDR